MSKKTLALISGLVLITVVLFVIALKTSNKSQVGTNNQVNVPTAPPVVPAHSVLSLSPNPVSVKAGQQGTANVVLDSSDNQVTAIQLELKYDPAVISNVKVAPGPFFPNAVVLIDKNNQSTGRVTYAFGVQPNHGTITGSGTVAIVTFTAKGAAGQSTQLSLITDQEQKTLITARGIAKSVLKSATGTTVTISQ